MRKIILISALIFVSVFCVGCNQDSKDEGNVEISVVTPFGEEDGNHINYVKAYQAYEEETGNIVKDNSGTTNEEWKKQVISDFENGNEADIVFFFTGADANSLIENGKVISISEIRKYNAEYASNMKDSMMPVSPSDGRQYTVPVNGYWEALYVNKKVLAECDIAVPGNDYTWEQFIEDCRVIKEKGYTPIACSLNEIPHYWFEFCTFNNGSIYNHATLPKNSGDEIGSVWVEGFNDIRFLYESGFFPDSTNTMTDSEANLLMIRNQAAFMLDGSWKLGWLQINANDIDDFTIAYVPAKGARRATDIVGGLSMGYYITKKAWEDPKKRQACVDFVMAMTTDEIVNTFGAISITALKNGTNMPDQADSLEMSALEMSNGCTGVVLAVQDGLSQTARDALFADVKNIVTGEKTPQQAVDDCLAIE